MVRNEPTAGTLSRRSFLKGSLASAALAAGGTSYLTGCAPKTQEEKAQEETAQSASEETVYSGVCRSNCYGGCHLNVHVRDGNIVRTSARELPEPAWTRICAKGLTHVFRVYDPNRAKYPMRRVGKRGEGEWEQITWDEALTEIAEKFQSYADEFGPSSVGFCTGAGNDAFLKNSTMSRLQNKIGASSVATPLDMAPFFSMNQVVGLSLNFHGNEMTDLVNAKTLVIWGSNPAVSQVQGMHFITEAHEKGTKLICIDPVYTATASKCDQWIPIAPGTDGLLAIALMNIILEKGWEDVEFVKQSTVAPFLVKESDGQYLRLSDLGKAKAGSEEDVPVVTDGNGTFGASDEIADPAIEGSFEVESEKVTCAYTLLLDRIAGYSVEEASRICGIPIEVMEGLAEDIAVNKPASLYVLLGIDHYTNGFYSIFDMGCITALTGNIGKPGAFCGISEGTYYLYSNPNAKLGSKVDGALGSKVSVPVFKMKEAIEAGEWLGEPFTLKALWVCTRNLLGNMCDRQYILDWLEQVELVVVSEVTMNEMARYADIFLPVCHWFEYEDVGATYPQNVFIEYSEKIIDPLYESKSDFDIVKELAEKMGFGADFDFTGSDYLEEYFDSDACNAIGLTYENIKEKKAVRALPGSPEHPFIHGEDGIPTKTGRVQFYIEPSDRAPSMDIGSDPDLSNFGLPYWEPPCEVPIDSAGDEKYPYQVLSDHQRLRTHSQWVNVAALRELDPEPTVKLHPDTAAAHGIGEGDYARIYNDYGHAVVKAHLSTGIRPGILLCSRGWEDTDFVDGHLQDVLCDEVSDICVTQAFFDTAAAIEKAEV